MTQALHGGNGGSGGGGEGARWHARPLSAPAWHHPPAGSCGGERRRRRACEKEIPSKGLGGRGPCTPPPPTARVPPPPAGNVRGKLHAGQETACADVPRPSQPRQARARTAASRARASPKPWAAARAAAAGCDAHNGKPSAAHAGPAPRPRTHAGAFCYRAPARTHAPPPPPPPRARNPPGLHSWARRKQSFREDSATRQSKTHTKKKEKVPHPPQATIFRRAALAAANLPPTPRAGAAAGGPHAGTLAQQPRAAAHSAKVHQSARGGRTPLERPKCADRGLGGRAIIKQLKQKTALWPASSLRYICPCSSLMQICSLQNKTTTLAPTNSLITIASYLLKLPRQRAVQRPHPAIPLHRVLKLYVRFCNEQICINDEHGHI